MSNVTVLFDLTGSAEHGQIVLYAEAFDTEPVGNLNVRFSVTGPGGIVYKAFPASPDFSFVALGSGQVNIPVPVDSDGNYIAGEYSVRCRIEDDGTPDPVPTVDQTKTFDFQPNISPSSFISPLVAIEYTLSCETGLYAAANIDAFVFAGFDVNYEIFVIPEAATGEETESQSNNQIYFNFQHTNADYLVRVEANGEKTETVSFGGDGSWNWSHYERGEAEVTVNVQCASPSICNVSTCLEKEYKKLFPKICASGWRSLTQKEKAKLMRGIYIAQNVQIYHDCGNDAKVREHIEKLEQHLDCSCECGEAPPSGPQPYTVPNFFND